MSKRPDFIRDEDILRWSNNLDNDSNLRNIKNIPTLKEVCFAGLYLAEELEKLDCPADLIVRIQYTAGSMSFGRDTWEVSLMLLEKFKNGELDFEFEKNSVN